MITANKTEQMDFPVSPIFRPSFIAAGVASGKFLLTDLGLEKICSTCGEFWPADSQFFTLRGEAAEARGLSSSCRACTAEMVKMKRGVHVPGGKQIGLDL